MLSTCWNWLWFKCFSEWKRNCFYSRYSKYINDLSYFEPYVSKGQNSKLICVKTLWLRTTFELLTLLSTQKTGLFIFKITYVSWLEVWIFYFDVDSLLCQNSVKKKFANRKKRTQLELNLKEKSIKLHLTKHASWIHLSRMVLEFGSDMSQYDQLDFALYYLFAFAFEFYLE